MKSHPFNPTMYAKFAKKSYKKKNTARLHKGTFLPLLHKGRQKARNSAYLARTGIMRLSHAA